MWERHEAGRSMKSIDTSHILPLSINVSTKKQISCGKIQ